MNLRNSNEDRHMISNKEIQLLLIANSVAGTTTPSVKDNLIY